MEIITLKPETIEKDFSTQIQPGSRDVVERLIIFNITPSPVIEIVTKKGDTFDGTVLGLDLPSENPAPVNVIIGIYILFIPVPLDQMIDPVGEEI